MTCAIEGCDREHYALTWCQLHYERNRRTGNPLGVEAKNRCGTKAGYHYHMTHGTPVCEPCRTAIKAYNKKHSRERRQRESDARRAYYAEIDSQKKERKRRSPFPSTNRESWVEIGACYGSSLNFHLENPAEIRACIQTCWGCQLISQCADEQRALRAPGVWAGIHWRSSAGTFNVISDEKFWNIRPKATHVGA